MVFTTVERGITPSAGAQVKFAKRRAAGAAPRHRRGAPAPATQQVDRAL